MTAISGCCCLIDSCLAAQIDRRMALHYAAMNGHSGTVGALLEFGADVLAKDMVRKCVFFFIVIVKRINTVSTERIQTPRSCSEGGAPKACGSACGCGICTLYAFLLYIIIVCYRYLSALSCPPQEKIQSSEQTSASSDIDTDSTPSSNSSSRKPTARSATSTFPTPKEASCSSLEQQRNLLSQRYAALDAEDEEDELRDLKYNGARLVIVCMVCIYAR